MPERPTDAAASEPQDPAPETEVPSAAPGVGALGGDRRAASTPEDPAPSDGESVGAPKPTGQMPEYKGEPLDSERGPGLGCFWIQIALLTFFLVFTPLTVTWGWPPLVSAALLFLTLILLLFSGQTIIFLLRLVAADRRTRRAPLDPSAKPTVGQMEDVAPESRTDAVPESEAEAASAGDEAVTPVTEPAPDEEKPADG